MYAEIFEDLQRSADNPTHDIKESSYFVKTPYVNLFKRSTCYQFYIKIGHHM